MSVQVNFSLRKTEPAKEKLPFYYYYICTTICSMLNLSFIKRTLNLTDHEEDGKNQHNKPRHGHATLHLNDTAKEKSNQLILTV